MGLRGLNSHVRHIKYCERQSGHPDLLPVSVADSMKGLCQSTEPPNAHHLPIPHRSRGQHGSLQRRGDRG